MAEMVTFGLMAPMRPPSGLVFRRNVLGGTGEIAECCEHHQKYEFGKAIIELMEPNRLTGF